MIGIVHGLRGNVMSTSLDPAECTDVLLIPSALGSSRQKMHVHCLLNSVTVLQGISRYPYRHFGCHFSSLPPLLCHCIPFTSCFYTNVLLSSSLRGCSC